ncbi:hypothetical protein MDA_GLEAN10005703 [Myotis davidii]|uniref:Uncharacterized protein n=1 Tax=Myotis davidii TaxID=225400 RepID=L5LVQ6_MYODS|nr:hypothetical protein MDA_GLEAN10005703 [Myotis davidii]
MSYFPPGPLPQAPCPFSYKPGPGSQGTGSKAPIPALGRAGELEGISPVQLAQEYVCTEYMAPDYLEMDTAMRDPLSQSPQLVDLDLIPLET